MAIAIIKAGMVDTLQDQGRYGYAHWGINPTGVMDTLASRMANLLVGNETTATVLEMTFPAAQLEFTAPALICIAGADFAPQLDSKEIPLWQPIWVPQGAVLRFTKKIWGAWAYLAIHGGFKTDLWLQSGSTHMKIKAGGLQGRRLQKGDLLEQQLPGSYLPSTPNATILPIGWRGARNYYASEISYLPGAEWDLLSLQQVALFESIHGSIEVKSDRMGYYLTEFKLQVSVQEELVSKGVSRGSIQLLPSGQPLVLMADHQTTGGYPVIGNVIHTSLYSLAQMVPGSLFHFKKVTPQFAESVYFSRELQMQQFKNIVHFKLLELCAR